MMIPQQTMQIVLRQRPMSSGRLMKTASQATRRRLQRPIQNFTTDNGNESAGFDGDETTDFESDNAAGQSGRNYVYVLSGEESQLFNKFSLDRTHRRVSHLTHFDVDVLASAFLEEIETSKRQYLQKQLAVGAPEVAVSAASLLTMSYLVWNMGSGLLLSTFMSSLPAWSSFDVLPVIANSAIAKEDDESIEQIVDA